jgi:transposase, IS5 family
MYGDKAYYDKENEALLKRKGIISKIHIKGYRYQKVTPKQLASNTLKSKTRARVEHIYAFMSNSMNRIYLRARSLVRIATDIGLINTISLTISLDSRS